jgi:hypothetical protein
LNKVFPETELLSEEKETKIISQIEKNLKHPVLGIIPCYCDVLKAKRDYLLTLKNPDHPFTEKLETIIEKLELNWGNIKHNKN